MQWYESFHQDENYAKNLDQQSEDARDETSLMVCLDTTFFADLFRKNQAAEKKLYELANETQTFSTTVMTIAELYYGACKSKNIFG